MTEAQYTKRYLDECKQEMPGSVVMKHSDRFTSGIPDASITYKGTTRWYEFKKWSYDWLDKLDQLQLHRMIQLQKEGYAYYIVFEGYFHTTYFPTTIKEMYDERQREKEIELARRKRKTTVQEPSRKVCKPQSMDRPVCEEVCELL
jgi:hypothetical protein